VLSSGSESRRGIWRTLVRSGARLQRPVDAGIRHEPSAAGEPRPSLLASEARGDDDDAWIAADPLHLPRGRAGPDEEPPAVVAHHPDGGRRLRAVTPERRQVDVPLRGKGAGV